MHFITGCFSLHKKTGFSNKAIFTLSLAAIINCVKPVTPKLFYTPNSSEISGKLWTKS